MAPSSWAGKVSTNPVLDHPQNGRPLTSNDNGGSPIPMVLISPVVVLSETVLEISIRSGPDPKTLVLSGQQKI